ncbi:hypothetical protein ACM66B_005075 [Microbotryomycetes sp. NB124-2]
MSGGVDSSVAARMLLEKGYDVQPVFMRNWDTLDEQQGASGGCEWERDFEAVENVCRQALGQIKPRLVDLSRQYWTDVFQRALDLWQIGQTPNPDVTCNQQIKFKELPAKLRELDPDAWLATGHYARLRPSPVESTLPGLLRAASSHKDQSYYLATSPVSALQRTMFPLGDMMKDDVRELARKWKLPTAERKESMGICFIGQRNRFSEWLDSYMVPHPGDIVNEENRVIGRHDGLWRYTIGEGARLPGQKERMFVGRKDSSTNTITVVPKGSPVLQCTSVATSDFHWSSPHHPPSEVLSPQGFHCLAQMRSLQKGSLSPCTVRQSAEGALDITLEHPITGVAPGQAVVLYLEDWCIGGGTISSTRTLADAKFEGCDDTARH